VLPLYGNSILRFNGTTDILFIFNFRKMADHLQLQRARLHNIESSDGPVRITRLAIPGRWANDFYRCPHCGRGPILEFPSEAFPNLKECFVCEDIHNSDEKEDNDRRCTLLESEVRASVKKLDITCSVPRFQSTPNVVAWPGERSACPSCYH
jgi:hypothetical protein